MCLQKRNRTLLVIVSLKMSFATKPSNFYFDWAYKIEVTVTEWNWEVQSIDNDLEKWYSAQSDLQKYDMD